MQDYNCHAVAEQVAIDKQKIITILRSNGIYALLTSPQQLTVDVINRYIEMKAKHAF